MARNKKGGVLTQELSKKAFSILAVAVMVSAAICVIMAAPDDSDAYSIKNDDDYVKTGNSTTFSIVNSNDQKVYCNWNLYNSSGSSQNSGSFNIDASSSYDQSVTMPSSGGDYKFVVKFYSDSDKKSEQLICERERWIKAVEPITITVTFSNSGLTSHTFVAYLVVWNGSEWKKVDDSTKTVTVSAHDSETGKDGSGTYTAEYVVKDLDRTTKYKVCTDNQEMKDVVKGLDQEFYFYTTQNDYTFMTVFMVIILLLIIIITIWIYRKPVKNYGKPKARR